MSNAADRFLDMPLFDVPWALQTGARVNVRVTASPRLARRQTDRPTDGRTVNWDDPREIFALTRNLLPMSQRKVWFVVSRVIVGNFPP